MRKLVGVMVAGTCAAVLAACASSKPTTSASASQAMAPPAAPPAAPTPVVSGTVGEQAVTVTATVEKIDLKKRRVTLRGPDGKSTTITVSDQVRNLPQVKKGDQVMATYYEAVAYDVVKAGEASPGVEVAAGAERAEPGQMPAGAAAQTTTVTATITAIDKSANTATLRGPQGKSVTVKVKDPSKLDKVAVGDLVRLTYTQALAIKVEKPTKTQ
jgi:hypothetical protein